MAAAELMQWVGKKGRGCRVELHSVSHSASTWSSSGSPPAPFANDDLQGAYRAQRASWPLTAVLQLWREAQFLLSANVSSGN
jgi:hypothetical protein